MENEITILKEPESSKKQCEKATLRIQRVKRQQVKVKVFQQGETERDD